MVEFFWEVVVGGRDEMVKKQEQEDIVTWEETP